MNVILVRTKGQRDGQAIANATGLVATVSTAPRLSSDGLGQIAWFIDDLDAAAAGSLTSELRGIFGAGNVTAITVSAAVPAPAAAAPEASPAQPAPGILGAEPQPPTDLPTPPAGTRNDSGFAQ